MQSKAIERNVSLAVFVCSVNRDTKKELMTRLHLKILNRLCLYLPFAVAFLVSTFPSLSIVISTLMTDLCQTVSWLIFFHHFAEMKYSKNYNKVKVTLT